MTLRAMDGGLAPNAKSEMHCIYLNKNKVVLDWIGWARNPDGPGSIPAWFAFFLSEKSVYTGRVSLNSRFQL